MLCSAKFTAEKKLFFGLMTSYYKFKWLLAFVKKYLLLDLWRFNLKYLRLRSKVAVVWFINLACHFCYRLPLMKYCNKDWHFGSNVTIFLLNTYLYDNFITNFTSFIDVPICKHPTEALVGAMKQETIQVICEMASDPPIVQFSWTFNNSGSEVIRVPQHHYSSTGTTSTLTYSPVTEMDYVNLAKINKSIEVKTSIVKTLLSRF